MLIVTFLQGVVILIDSETIGRYEEIIAAQNSIINNYSAILKEYEKKFNKKPIPYAQRVAEQEILAEHLKNSNGELLEFDSLKISNEERRKRFGTRVKNMRKSLALTQEELAKKLGISKQAIVTYENGMREPPFKNLIGLARTLNVTTDWLLGVSSP